MESKSDSLDEKKDQKTETKQKPILPDFEKELNEKPSVEEKIRFCLEYMKQSIARSGKPDFKGFWEVRRLCLPLFKDPMHPTLRADFWKEYIDMTEEARRLKGILEEQTSFTVEQITIAIDAIEKELLQFEGFLRKIPNLDLPKKCRSINENRSFYNDTQREIILLNSFATRVTSLRKELIDCEMRISMKNKLFKQLSAIGDQIFPKRKELMLSVTDAFHEDVDGFVKYFQKEIKGTKTPYFVLRDEIKCLQNIAKTLNVKTSTYLATRKKLSECWDKLKELDTKRRAELDQKREETNKQYEEIIVKIEELSKKCKEKISFEEADKISDGIFELMKSFTFSREEIKDLKKKINEAKEPLYEDQIKEKENKEKKAAQKREKIDSFIQEMENYLAQKISEDASHLEDTKNKWKEGLSSLNINDDDREVIESRFAILDDLIFNAEEDVILAKEPSQEVFKQLFDKRLDYRNRIKENLASHRKLVNEARLSFEKSIFYQDLLEKEKERLEKCDERLEFLEDQLLEDQ